LKEGDKDFRKRNVTVAQMDFQKLEECYQQLAGDASKSIWDASEKLSSKAVSEILDLFVVMAEEKNAALKKKAKTAAPTAGELAAEPYFQHAYTRCGVNSMEQLRKCHLVKLGISVERANCLLELSSIDLFPVPCKRF